MISEFHLRAWARIPEVEVVGLADPRREAAEARRDAHAPQARVHPTLAALLDAERPDLVEVLTPPWRHAEHCLAAAEAGAHVICQKPLCDELDAARRLVAAMDERGQGRRFVVHENHRFRPWFDRLLAEVRAGAIGAPRFLRIDQFDPREPPEAFKNEAPRAALYEYGTHLVDLMRALLGEPRRVFARAHRPNPRVRGESLAHATYDFGEATAVIDVAWKASGLPHGGLVLVGDEGEAIYEGTLTRGESARFRLVRRGDVLVDEARRPTDDYVESFHRLSRACVDAILSGAPAPQPAADNLRTLAATFAPYASIAEGRVVDLSEPAFAVRAAPRASG
jgi:predicted dehydrogenase